MSCVRLVTMSERKHLHLGLFLLVCILYVNSGQAVKVENIFTQSDFYQILEPNGEYMFQIDGDEIFYVDLQTKETRWKLPEFGQLARFEGAVALSEINVLKHNLEIYEKRSNYTKAKSVFQDDIQVYTEKPLVLGQPIILICHASRFFPPVIKMSWLKNNNPVTEGVSETDFYPVPDGSFSKFLYLASVPQKDDVYTCSVEHAGLVINPTNRNWPPVVPRHASETSENIVCGLGLAYGIIGIVAGIALICKGKKNMNLTRGH